jgi:hypothetical protein
MSEIDSSGGNRAVSSRVSLTDLSTAIKAEYRRIFTERRET